MKRLLAATLLAAAIPLAAQAQWKPTDPVEIVIGAGAGGTVDAIARQLGKALTDLGLVDTPVTVVNKPGSGAAIAMAYMEQHAGDPHFLTLMSPSLITTAILNGEDKPYAKVTPIAKLFESDLTAATSVKSGLNSIEDVAAKLKQDPTSVSFSFSTSAGNPVHIAIAQFAEALGIDPLKLRIVVNKSGSETWPQVAGGHVDVGFGSTGSLQPLIDAGEMKILATLGAERMPKYPDVETFTEAGYDVQAGAWYAMAAASGITDEQKAFWEAAFKTIAESEDMVKTAQDRNWTMTYLGPTDAMGYFDGLWEDQTAALKNLGLVK